MKKIVPIIIILVLIFGLGGGMAWKFYQDRYAPTKDYLDYAQALGLAEDEYSVTLNHELSSYRAVKIDGRVYLDMDLVTTQVNTRFYYDTNENVFIYTNATQQFLFTPDEQTYTIKTWDGSSSGDEGYAVVRTKDGKNYVAADYVRANTQMEYTENEDPNRVNIVTSWGEEQTVTTTKETAVRYKGGVKGEILRMAQSGETMYLIEAYDDWYNVATDDGFIGWISTKDAGSPQTTTAQAPEFTQPEYSSIHKDYKINMTWHQVMTKDANADIASKLETAPGINTISPTWFYFSDTDGTLVSLAGKKYVNTCHDNGVEVWALFSNEFPSGEDRVFDSTKTDEVLGYTSKREKVIRKLIKYVNKYDIDGINLDFELITEDGADNYIEFIRELSIACRANGIVLSVDSYVPQYTPYYNRKEQGIVCDYVVTMCYDETDATSTVPGPTASDNFVSTGITDTLEEVDKSKVICGIPFFTRVWSTSPDGTVTSFACGMTEALGYLTDHGVTPVLQEDTGLNYGSYTSDVDGNTYEIWLQDGTSVSSEMAMIKENDLAGVASWKLGFESGTEIWNTISDNLK